MFLKSLIISSKSHVIREILFHKGINLIIDETHSKNDSDTGNNVGKTTVLKLIDVCLGTDPKIIYTEAENKRSEHVEVKNFLIKNEILITLTLKENLDVTESFEIIIERNFLSRNKIIRTVNGKELTEKEFDQYLLNLIFPNFHSEKPTFRQIISHNIRYRDESLNNTLKTLDRYTTDAEYEALYLFLFGCEFYNGNLKQELLTKIKLEEAYKNRLEKLQTKSAYESALSIIDEEIDQLNLKKSNFNLNENFETDFENLNNVKYEINKISSEISRLKIKKEIINDAKSDLNKGFFKSDLMQLKIIYQQASLKIDRIQKTFEQLVEFHNKMIDEKVKYIIKDLPNIEKDILIKEKKLDKLLDSEKNLSSLLSKSSSFEELEKIITELNEKFRKKGEYENIILQFSEVEKEIKRLNYELTKIDEEIFSNSYEQNIKTQLNKFNKHFSDISNKLYAEKYAIKFDQSTNKLGQKFYKFTSFNTNFSSGKKQGEISCFDISYIMFADEENIPCLHFVLNDKKELMHNNQLSKIAQIVNKNGIQFVASILKDKLPNELNKEEYFILKLSTNNKLFRIENFQ